MSSSSSSVSRTLTNILNGTGEFALTQLGTVEHKDSRDTLEVKDDAGRAGNCELTWSDPDTSL